MKLVILAVAAALIVVGCSSSGSPATPRTSSPAQTPEQRFLAEARHLDGDLYPGLSDGQLLADGRGVCADWRAGNVAYDHTDSANGWVSSGAMTWAQAGGIERSARDQLCPVRSG